MRGRSSGKTGPPVPGLTRVGGGAKTKVVNWAEPEARALVAGRTRSLCPVSNPDLTKNHYDCIFEYI